MQDISAAAAWANWPLGNIKPAHLKPQKSHQRDATEVNRVDTYLYCILTNKYIHYIQLHYKGQTPSVHGVDEQGCQDTKPHRGHHATCTFTPIYHDEGTSYSVLLIMVDYIIMTALHLTLVE